MEPGSAVSAQLVRGDMEISATCTVTYIDPKQLLACGHPILQAGPVSLPMTAADVVATLASPLNAFKIINTGATIGAFTQDRDSAISGILGARAHMIPMHVAIDAPEGKRAVNVEILDLPLLTPQAMEVVLYDSLLQSNDSTADSSYHVTGSIDIEGHAAFARRHLGSAERSHARTDAGRPAGRRTALRGSTRTAHVKAQCVPSTSMWKPFPGACRWSWRPRGWFQVIPLTQETQLKWRQPFVPGSSRRAMSAFPSRCRPGWTTGNLRLLVSDAGTLDRTLNQPRSPAASPILTRCLHSTGAMHAADRVYVSLLVPETQAGISGETLTSLPLSVANALEPMRSAQQAGLNGESAVVVGRCPGRGSAFTDFR